MTKLCVIESAPWMVQEIIVIDDDANEADFGGRQYVEGDRVGDMVALANDEIQAEVDHVNMLLRVYERQAEAGQVPFITAEQAAELQSYRDEFAAMSSRDSFPRIPFSTWPAKPFDVKHKDFVQAFLSV
jgi:hypothetical protein